MRAEKKFISAEYVNRLKATPFFLVVDYRGLSVGQFTELRKRLSKAGAEVHVVKNTIFRIAAKEAGVADLGGALAGQLAIVTGQKDIAAAAKVVKAYQSEFDKPKLQFGYLGSQRLSAEELRVIPTCRRCRSSRASCWDFCRLLPRSSSPSSTPPAASSPASSRRRRTRASNALPRFRCRLGQRAVSATNHNQSKSSARRPRANPGGRPATRLKKTHIPWLISTTSSKSSAS